MKIVDLAGKKFGRFLVIEPDYKRNEFEIQRRINIVKESKHENQHINNHST